jgi:hypothetical protein
MQKRSSYPKLRYYFFELAFHAAVISPQAQSTAAMQKKRDDANPAKSDAIIAGVITPVSGGNRNADGMPSLAQPPPIVPVLRGYSNPRAGGGGTGAVPRPSAAHPAAVQVEILDSADGGSRVLPIQTGHSSNKRRSVLLGVAAGGTSPATKSRNTDSMIADFQALQQEGMKSKAVKAQAALMTAKASQIQNQLQTLMYFAKEPDSDMKRLITANAQQSLAELSKPDDSYSSSHSPHLVPVPDSTRSVPASTQEVVVEKESKECTICHDPILENTPSMITPCMHSFHFGCMRNWLMRKNDNCPNCRASLEPPYHSPDHD